MTIRLIIATFFVALHFSLPANALDGHGVVLRDLRGCPFSRLASYGDQKKALKEEHLQYFSMPKDNKKFIRRWRGKRSVPGVLFVHIENGIVKLLNEKILEDKQATGALLNLYKRILYEELATHPLLTKHLVPVAEGGVYSDFKVIRAALRVKNDQELVAVVKELKVAYEAVARTFHSQVRTYPSLYAKLEGRTDLAGNPSFWQLAGVGKNPEEAAYESRQGRKKGLVSSSGTEQVIPLRVYNRHSSEALAQEVQEIEARRKAFSGDSAMKRLRPLFTKDGILSPRMLEIFKDAKNDPKIQTETQYLQRMRQDVWLGFGVHATTTDMLNIKKYLEQVDELMPSLFITEEEPIHLAEMHGAKHGVLSFDLEDAGNANTLPVMAALRDLGAGTRPGQTDDEFAENVLATLRTGQDKASRKFIARRNYVAKLLAHRGLLDNGAKLTASGDDATLLPSRTLTPADIDAVSSDLQARRGRVKARVTSQPQTYSESGKEIDPADRFELVSRMETLQKQGLKWGLRRALPELWRNGVLDKTQFTVIAEPVNESRTGVVITIHLPKDAVNMVIRAKMSALVKAKVQELYGRDGYTVKEVHFDDEFSERQSSPLLGISR